MRQRSFCRARSALRPHKPVASGASPANAASSRFWERVGRLRSRELRPPPLCFGNRVSVSAANRHGCPTNLRSSETSTSQPRQKLPCRPAPPPEHFSTALLWDRDRALGNPGGRDAWL